MTVHTKSNCNWLIVTKALVQARSFIWRLTFSWEMHSLSVCFIWLLHRAADCFLVDWNSDPQSKLVCQVWNSLSLEVHSVVSSYKSQQRQTRLLLSNSTLTSEDCMIISEGIDTYLWMFLHPIVPYCFIFCDVCMHVAHYSLSPIHLLCSLSLIHSSFCDVYEHWTICFWLNWCLFLAQ